MEVAPRYTLLSLLTMFTLFKKSPNTSHGRKNIIRDGGSTALYAAYTIIKYYLADFLRWGVGGGVPPNSARKQVFLVQKLYF